MKRVFLLLLLGLSICAPIFAEVVVDNPIEKKGEDSSGRPRSIELSIGSFANGDNLTIDVNRYVGYVQVSVIALDGGEASYNYTYYINGHSCFTLDFSSFTEGAYSLVFTMQNGSVYTGTVTKY